MKRNLSLICILTMAIFVLVGCGPKGNPEEILNKYYENIKNSNTEVAYETLSEQSKKDFKKEEFTKWRNTEKEVYKLKEAKIEKGKELKGTLDGVEFKNIVEFNVAEKGQDLYADKEVEQKHKMYVVNDSGNWKIYLGKQFGKQITSVTLSRLASMYINGKGNKPKDLDKGISILKEAIEIDADNKDFRDMLMRAQQMNAGTSLK